MNVCLSIEATGRHLGFSLLSFNNEGRTKLLGQFYRKLPGKQSDVLIPTLEKLMRSARCKKSALSLIAVDIGPGSFTGVRVGLAVARTLAQALSLPLVGISSLEAMARAAGQHPSIIVPQIPALAGEVYFAAYKSMKQVKKPCWEPEAVFQKFLSQHPGATVVTAPPHPKAIADLAVERYLEKSPRAFRFEKVEPLYLQPSWAERKK